MTCRPASRYRHFQREFEQRLAEMVGQALRDSCTPTNPRTPDAHALTELYRRAWTGTNRPAAPLRGPNR
jgi:alcohol dehydrogenase class IV